MDAASPTEQPLSIRKKGSARPTRPYWAWTVATFFGAGALKPGPGTWGSLAAVLTWALIARHLPPHLLIPGALAYCALATAIGIPAATLTARACHRDDPSHVVIDEVAGQMLTLVAAPLTWKAQLAGFYFSAHLISSSHRPSAGWSACVRRASASWSTILARVFTASSFSNSYCTSAS